VGWKKEGHTEVEGPGIFGNCRSVWEQWDVRMRPAATVGDSVIRPYSLKSLSSAETTRDPLTSCTQRGSCGRSHHPRLPTQPQQIEGGLPTIMMFGSGSRIERAASQYLLHPSDLVAPQSPALA
jgi:hypothetical protein